MSEPLQERSRHSVHTSRDSPLPASIVRQSVRKKRSRGLEDEDGGSQPAGAARRRPPSSNSKAGGAEWRAGGRRLRGHQVLKGKGSAVTTVRLEQDGWSKKPIESAPSSAAGRTDGARSGCGDVNGTKYVSAGIYSNENEAEGLSPPPILGNDVCNH